MEDVKGLSRRERAERTRRAIVRAATAEFRASGYPGTTMAGVAERAGVAVQTVYFVFHTKPLLLTAAIDAAVIGEDDPVPPEFSPWWLEGTTTSDGRRAVELFVTNVATIESRAATLNRVAVSAALTEIEVVDVLSHHESMRVAGFRSYLESFVTRGLLRDGLDAAEATDVLLTLAGPEVFLAITEGRGWSVERYVAWTTDLLSSLLLARH